MLNKILGVHINPINMPLALQSFEKLINDNKRHYVCVVPGHVLMDAHTNPALKNTLNRSSLNTPDGMAIVWALNLRGFHQVQRVYGPDLLLAVCEFGLSRGWRHYFYGGETGIINKLASRLQTQFPNLLIVGTYSPPFRALSAEEENTFIQDIQNTKPHVLWVGLGSPKQEFWMEKMLGKIPVPVMVGVGAAFDFLSGNKKQAPIWVQKIGFEWLYRLTQEPKRLWPRYKQYPHMLWLLIKNHFSSTKL